MKQTIFFVLILIGCSYCQIQNIDNCSDKQAKMASATTLSYWNKVQKVVDAAALDLGSDSILAKTDYRKLEQKYKGLFDSVFGQDTSIYLLNFAITFQNNSNEKSRTGSGYFIQHKDYNSKKSATMYSPFEINSQLGTKFQVYHETRIYESYTYQVLRFSTDRHDYDRPPTLDFHIEIRIPDSLNIKCLKSIN